MRTLQSRSAWHPVRHLWALAAAAVLALAAPASVRANTTFASPEAAMNALGQAISSNDDAALKALLGANFRDLIPPVGATIRERFLAAWAESHSIRPEGDSHAVVAVGHDDWTLPIPLVKSAHGWQFDTSAGAEEMRIRRIGRNERAAMQTLLAVHDAQVEYAATDHDGDGVLSYATRLSSSPGKQDGLYWPTPAGEKPSPLGAAVANAGAAKGADGYYGYHYRLLTAQGPHAQGGALNYVVRGKLFGGFAVIAWPVRYGDSGVMSFIVSHTGEVYERDLGTDTAAKVSATKSFDPGPGWTKVSP